MILKGNLRSERNGIEINTNCGRQPRDHKEGDNMTVIFEVGRFVGLLLLWTIFLTFLKFVFYIPIEPEKEVVVSIVYIAASYFLCSGLVFRTVRE